MPINENLKSGGEAQDIFSILLAAAPENERESSANANTFSGTLMTVFYHDNLLRDGPGERWLTADCAQNIYDLAIKAPDLRLRLVAASKLGFLSLREQHRQTAMKVMSDIIEE